MLTDGSMPCSLCCTLSAHVHIQYSSSFDIRSARIFHCYWYSTLPNLYSTLLNLKILKLETVFHLLLLKLVKQFPKHRLISLHQLSVRHRMRILQEILLLGVKSIPQVRHDAQIAGMCKQERIQDVLFDDHSSCFEQILDIDVPDVLEHPMLTNLCHCSCHCFASLAC